jgi:hypothetical protein
MTTSSMPPSASSEQLNRIDETLRVLIDTLMNQTKRLTAIEKAQSDLTITLSSKPSTSETSELDSLRSDVNEIKKTLNKQSEMLSELGETVSDKRVVKTSDGSSVSASELQAHSMMKQLSNDLTKTTSALGELTAQVKAKSHVSLNAEKVAEVMSRRVTQHFEHAVQEPVDGLRSDLQGFREEMSTLGAERLSEVHRTVEKSLSELNEARRNIEAIERRVTFVGISRLALAVLPLFASLLLVGSLVWGFGSMVGIGPLFGWAWASFTAASLWWQKMLIAAATLSAAVLFVWAVLRVSRWVYEELR